MDIIDSKKIVAMDIINSHKDKIIIAAKKKQTLAMYKKREMFIQGGFDYWLKIAPTGFYKNLTIRQSMICNSHIRIAIANFAK